MKNSAKKLFTNQRDAAVVFLLLAASCVMIYGWLVLNGYYFVYLDVGSDTIHSFYPIYRMAAEMLRNHSFSQWSFSIGMGADIFNYTSVMMDPFAWPVILAGAIRGPEVIAGLLVWMQAAKILVCGLLCLRFLKLHGLTGLPAIAASYVYGLNGFLILWGQHYWLGTACFWVILVLTGLEKSIRGRRFQAGLVIATAGMLLQSVYVGYMTLLCGAFYALFRIAACQEKKGLREWWRLARGAVASVLCGFLISMVTFLPTAYIILCVSGRVSAEEGLLQNLLHWLRQPFIFSEIQEICNRWLSTNIHGTGDYYSMKYADAGRAEVVRYVFRNYYEAPQLYYSCLFPVLAVVWGWERLLHEKNRKRLLMTLCALILGGILIFVPAGSMVMNAFAYPFGRYTFVLMPFFALIMARGLELLGRKRYSAIAVCLCSLALSAVCWKRSAYYAGQGTETILKSAAIGMTVFAAACAVYRHGNGTRGKKAIEILCLAVLFGNVTADSFVTTNERGLASTEISWMQEDSMADVKAALDWLEKEDTGLYRVEKNFVSISSVTDPVALQYYGVAGYNTMASKGMQLFYLNIWQDILAGTDPYRQYYIDAWREWQQSALTGVKYLLSEAATDVPEPYEEVGRFGDVVVYRNPYVDTMGFVLEALPDEEEMTELPWAESANLIMYYLERQVGTVSLYEEKGDEIVGDVYAEADGILYLAIPADEGWTIRLDGEEAEADAAFYGFLSIPVTAGSHTLTMTYRAPGFDLGLGLSCAGILLFAAAMAAERRKRRRQTSGAAPVSLKSAVTCGKITPLSCGNNQKSRMVLDNE